MPDLKKMLTLEALSEALPSWLKRATKPEYNADEIDSTLTTNQFVTATDKENWNAKGTYSKPSGGIPKSDLSSLVQTSLEKADSALQSETDPTVPSWAKQTNKPSYTQDEVADGSTYKRVTQTEKNTWNGKQNALTTTQMQAVNSGITSAGVAQISTNQTNILSVEDMVCATEFSSSTAYAVGDMVTYEHKLYKFINAHQGAWSASDVQNYDLTRLESEDRAALADVVDEGAKNEFEFGEFTTGDQAVTTVTTSDNSITVTGASAWAKAWRTFRVKKNTTYVLSFCVTNVATVTNPNYRVSLGNNHHSGGSYYGIIGCNTTGNYHMEFTPPTDTDIYLVINPNYAPSAVSDTPSITVDNIMICTKAEYDVSQVYIPYRKSLDQLEAEDRAALADAVDAGNKNLIKVALDYIVSANNTLTWNENVGTTSDGHTTFTINQTDGTIRVQSDGSNTQSQFYIIGESVSPYFTIDERYVISGCPSGGSETKYDLRAWNGSVYYIDRGNSFAFTCSVTRLKVDIVIRANQTLDLTFKPMICKEIDWNVSNKLVPGELTGGLKPVYRYNSSTGSKAFSYTIKRDDFITDGICTTGCGTYIVSVINWSSTPLFSLYAISFSGGVTSYVNVTKIAGEDLTITVTESTFSFSTNGTVRIYALV